MVVPTFFFFFFMFMIIIKASIPRRRLWLFREYLEAIFDEIPRSRRDRMHQVLKRQTAQVFGSVLHDGINADFEPEGLENGEYGQVDAFERAGDGSPTAFLRVRVLVVAEEAEDTAFALNGQLEEIRLSGRSG